MARLDRLGPVKEFAQIGACIGREFSYELLERISTQRAERIEASLQALVDSGLVTRNDSPAAVYTFKHALVQDTAYESLLKSRRSELHARIAQVLENDFADRVANAPEWLAHHHTHAGHLAQAIPLWRKAGTLAVQRVALKGSRGPFPEGAGVDRSTSAILRAGQPGTDDPRTAQRRVDRIARMGRSRGRGERDGDPAARREPGKQAEPAAGDVVGVDQYDHPRPDRRLAGMGESPARRRQRRPATSICESSDTPRPWSSTS